MAEENKECEVRIQIECPTDKLECVYNAREELSKIGVGFDSGGHTTMRNGRKVSLLDWELDWSLKGPIKVYFKRFKNGGK